MAKPGIQLVLPDKKATALGVMIFKVFDRLGISAAVERNTLAYAETGPKVIAMLTVGRGDAAIAEYSDAYKNRDNVDLMMIDPALNVIEGIPCAVLTCSTQKETAADFQEFMIKEGPAVFAKYGFKTRL